MPDGITTAQLDAGQVGTLLNLREGQFGDLKARAISPSALSKAISALANADGGDLYIGIAETAAGGAENLGWLSE